MPIQIIPAPNVPDPMQQMGQMYEMMTMMQMAPLKRQALEGQIQNQALERQQTEQSISASKSSQQIQETEQAARVSDRATKDRGLEAYSNTFIQNLGKYMTPEEQAQLPAAIAAGIPIEQVMQTVNAKAQMAFAKANPLTAAELRARDLAAAASGRTAAAAEENRLLNREARARAAAEDARLAEGRGALSGLVGGSLDRVNYDPRLTALAVKATSAGVPISQLPEEVQVGLSPVVRARLAAEENSKTANALALKTGELAYEKMQVELEAFKTNKLSPKEFADGMARWSAPILQLEETKLKNNASAMERIEKMRQDPVHMAMGPRDRAVAESTIAAGTKKLNDDMDGLIRRYSELMDGPLKELGVHLNAALDPNAIYNAKPADPGVSAPPPPTPQVKAVPGLDPVRVSTIQGKSLNEVIALLDTLAPPGSKMVSDQARQDAWRIFSAYGIPTDAEKVDEWIRDRFRNSPDKQSYGGKQVVLWPARQVQRIKQLQPLLMPPVAGVGAGTRTEGY